MIPRSPTPNAPKCSRLGAVSLLRALTLLALPATAFVAHGQLSPDEPAAETAAPIPDSIAIPASDAPSSVEAIAPAATTAIPLVAPSLLPEPEGIPQPSLSPKEAQGLVNLGGNLTERSDFDAAEIAYRQVLKGNAPLPQTKSALLGLARMHRKQGALTKAAAIYERYLKEYPGDDRVPDALLDLGRTLRDMGAPRLAISRFYNVINSTLKLPSDSGFEHYQLLAKTAQFEVAETHFQSGDFEEANKFFSRLRMLDLAPADRARAHFKAGYSLQLSGDFEAAVISLRAFLEQWPDDENVPEARFLLATSLRQLNRTQDALTATLDLLRAERSRSNADAKRWNYWQRRTGNHLANEFYQGGDIINALAIYRGLAALAEDPSWRLAVTYQIALCYERLGDVTRACETYRELVEATANDAAPELADIGRMAASRLAHVDWRAATERQVATLFDSTTGHSAPTSPHAAIHDSDRSPETAPATL